METKILYCVEYNVVDSDEEKEVMISRVEEFNSILSMVKWARVLPRRYFITRKYKKLVESFSSLDHREFEIEFERQHPIQ